MKKVVLVLAIISGVFALSPQLFYWWGLSNLDKLPVPTQNILKSEEELAIWHQYGLSNRFEIVPSSPYEYLYMLYDCGKNNATNPNVCLTSYTSITLSALAVRPQVISVSKNQSALAWHITWAASAIWVTRNWDARQVTATYVEVQSNQGAKTK